MNAKLNLKGLSIVDFETRVKKYAYSGNKGKITIEALQEAFKDTGTFRYLDNPNSVVHKVVLSPFFTDLTMSHNKKSTEAMNTPVKSVTPEGE